MQKRVFHLLIVRLAVVSLLPAIVAGWLVHPLVGLGAGSLLAVWELWRIRRAVVSAVPATMRFVPARRTDHRWIDDDGFRAQLAELHQLGFRPLADCHPEYPGAPRAFGRVLVHPRARIYAEVNQSIDGRVPLPVATAFGSTLTNGWTLSSTTREVMATTVAFMRAPKQVWKCAPEMSITGLFHDHIAQRARLCDELDLTIDGTGTMEDYVSAQVRQHDERRATVRSVNIVRALLTGLSCERRPVREWRGGMPTHS